MSEAKAPEVEIRIWRISGVRVRIVAMTSDQPTLPLTSDVETLQQLLFECPDVDGAMLLSELDGYLAALLVSPHPIAQDIWLPEIWGGGEFPGEPERCALLARLALTRKAEIASELLQGDMAYLPIFDIDDNSNEVLWELWIEGFARAVVLSDKEWDVLFESDDEDLAAAAMGILMYVARASGIDVGDAPLDEDVPPEVMIPYLVETLYRCQNGLPGIVMDTPWEGPMQPVVRPKIGRNSPCPCGSGKKFKKCCGAN